MKKKKIIHIITGLGDGGAEKVQFRIIKNTYKSYNHEVISLMDKGKYGHKLEQLGVNVHCIYFKRGSLNINGLIKLFKLIKNSKCDILQTWMYHSDLLGGLIGYFTGHKKIIWNVRGDGRGLIKNNIKSRFVFYACVLFSYIIPKKIITCSYIAKHNHINSGYKKIFKYIPNGYDYNQFNEDNFTRIEMRKKLSIKDSEILIGMIARYSDQKNHIYFIDKMKDIFLTKPFIKVIFVGKNIKNNEKILKKLNKLNIKKFFILLDSTNEIQNIMNALDIHVLFSKYGEGFPNVVAESMLCKIPSIARDVGDTKYIIGNRGWIIQDEKKLNLSIDKAIKMKIKYPNLWSRLKTESRARIIKKYEIAKMVREYNQLWNSI